MFGQKYVFLSKANFHFPSKLSSKVELWDNELSYINISTCYLIISTYQVNCELENHIKKMANPNYKVVVSVVKKAVLALVICRYQSLFSFVNVLNYHVILGEQRTNLSR